MTDIVIVDIETTGLSPEHDIILEVGALWVDGDLNIKGQSHSVLYADLENYTGLAIDPVVKDMHIASGLWQECKKSGTTLIRASLDLQKWIEDNNLTNLPMCGSSVHFDRSFLKKHMPAVEGCFHYRNLDVSTLKICCEMWKPGIFSARPEGQKLHRALPDCHDTLEELRYYRTFLL